VSVVNQTVIAVSTICIKTERHSNWCQWTWGYSVCDWRCQ